MSISVFARYRLKCKGKYSYNTPSYDCPNDWHTERVRWQQTMSGGELMEFIAAKLKDTNIIEVDFRDNYIYCDYFNPNTGVSGNYYYYIEIVESKRRVNNDKKANEE